MREHSIERDGVAFIIVILLLFIGLAAVWISKANLRVWQTSNDLYYATLILAPILIYAIASGRIKQLKVGGLEAVFGDNASRPIEPSLIEVKDVIAQEKLAIIDLDEKIDHLCKEYRYKKVTPIVLTLCLEQSRSDDSRYTTQDLLLYIKKFSCYGELKLVVILDKNKHVKAYIPSYQILILLSCDNGPGTDFIKAINEGELHKIIRIPGMITSVIKRKNTNTDALRLMLDQGIDTLVVVDDDGILIGIVEQQNLIIKLLTKIIVDSERPHAELLNLK